MPTVEELILQIKADNKDINMKLTDLNKKIGSVGKETADIAKSSSFSLGKIKLGWLAAAGAVAGAIRTIKNFTDAAIVQRRAEAQLNAVLKSTGQAAGLTAEELKNMASELQNVTNFGDEAVIGAENLLLTFKNIGRDTFPQALKSVLNVSTAMGQDLKNSAIQVGKALNDPIQGLTALRRVGITFNKEQENQIKSFARLGEVTKAQTIILEELESQFGGSAEAIVKADAGLTQLKNVFGDLKETIGSTILDSIEPFIKNLTDAIKWINKTDTTTTNLIDIYEEYKSVLIDLQTEVDNLTEAERNNLETKRELLKEDLLRALEDYGNEYKELQEIITETTDEDIENLLSIQDLESQRNLILNKITETQNKIYENDKQIRDIQIEFNQAEYNRLLTTGQLADANEDQYKITTRIYETEKQFNDRVLAERQKLLTQLRNLDNDITKSKLNQSEIEKKSLELSTKENKLINAGAELLKENLITINQIPDNLQYAVTLRVDELRQLELQRKLLAAIEDQERILNENRQMSSIDINERIEKFKQLISEGNFSLKEQLKYWKQIYKIITDAGIESEELYKIIKNLSAELEKKMKIEIVGKNIAEGLSAALSGSTGKEGANNFVNFLIERLKSAGFIGAIIAAAIEFVKNISGKNLKKFFDDFNKELGNIIAKVVEGIIVLTVEYLSNPVFWFKIIAAALAGFAKGIIEAFKQVGRFIKSIFTGTFTKELAKSLDGVISIFDESGEAVDNLSNRIKQLNDIISKYELHVRAGTQSLQDQIEFYNKILDRLEKIGASQEDIIETQIHINELEAAYVDEQLHEILQQDELLKLKEKAGIYEGDRIDYLKDLLSILKKEKKEIIDFAEANNINLESLDEFWDVLIEINEVQEEITDIQNEQIEFQNEQNELLQDQIDLQKELNNQQLSGLEKYIRRVLELQGLPEFQISALLSGFDFPKLIADFRELQAAIPSDLMNLEPIAPAQFFPGMPEDSIVNQLQGLFGTIQPSTTTTNMNIGSFIDTFNNQSTLDIEVLRDLVSQLFNALGFNK